MATHSMDGVRDIKPHQSQSSVVAVENSSPEVIHVVNVSRSQQAGAASSNPHVMTLAGLAGNPSLQTFTISAGNLQAVQLPISLGTSQVALAAGLQGNVSTTGGPTQIVIPSGELASKLKEGLPIGGSVNVIDVATKLRELQQQRSLRPPVEEKFELCVVCGDRASGRHYGVISCEGCKGFFKRSIRKQLGYACRGNRDCPITKHYRNRCQYCRLQKCLAMGMRSECVTSGKNGPIGGVQQERKPPEQKETKLPLNVATSTQRIYIRKDFGSPSAAIPTFETSSGEIKSPNLLANLEERLVHTDHGTIMLSTNTSVNSSQNTNLSTLANVVTSLATMGKKDGSLSEDPQSPPTPNGTSSAEGTADSAAKAFDTMAKAVVPGAAMLINQQSEGTESNMDQSTMEINMDESMLVDFDGPILNESSCAFQLMTPSPMPAYLNVHYICETASRLLFLSMHWAKAIPAFGMLSQDIQVCVVRLCWSELFILGLAQCSRDMNLPTILAAIINHLQSNVQEDKVSGDRVKVVTETIMKLQEFVNMAQRLQIDYTEYAYLKLLVLFSPDHPSVGNLKQLERFQEKAMHELQDYCSQAYGDQPDRVCKLLLRLPSLRLLSPSIMEELFFAGLIGNVQIDSIIPYILRMETSEYNSQVASQVVSGSHVEQPSPANSQQSSQSGEMIVVTPSTLAHHMQNSPHSSHQSSQGGEMIVVTPSTLAGMNIPATTTTNSTEMIVVTPSTLANVQ